MELKKIIKKIGYRVKYFRAYTFKNRLPLSLNFLHYSYDKLNRIRHANDNYQQFANTKAIAEGIRQNGFYMAERIIPPEVVTAVKERIDKVYTERIDLDTKHEDAGTLQINNGVKTVPEIEQVLDIPEIKAALHEFYGGDYRLFHLNIYRTLPKIVPESSSSSDRWHFDNVTPDQLKLMFYFTDVRANTGAMQVVDKGNSHRLRKNGFVSRNKVKNYAEDIDRCALPLAAPAGSVAFFQPQHCIHRATEPQVGLRDVMVLMVYPHLKQKVLDEKDKEGICTLRSSLKNPWKWPEDALNS